MIILKIDLKTFSNFSKTVLSSHSQDLLMLTKCFLIFLLFEKIGKKKSFKVFLKLFRAPLIKTSTWVKDDLDYLIKLLKNYVTGMAARLAICNKTKLGETTAATSARQVIVSLLEELHNPKRIHIWNKVTGIKLDNQLRVLEEYIENFIEDKWAVERVTNKTWVWVLVMNMSQVVTQTLRYLWRSGQNKQWHSLEPLSATGLRKQQIQFNLFLVAYHLWALSNTDSETVHTYTISTKLTQSVI